jgi:putative ABC transport system permease protein
MFFYLRRDRFDRELEEEMRFHLELKMEEKVDAGVSSEEARSAAQRQFGNQTLLREVSREMWAVKSIETLVQDLRYGARMLLKHPGFTFAAALTLTLGIGVNTALFTVFDALMLKPLPVKDSDSLVSFSGVDRNGGRQPLFSYLDYLDYRDHNTTLTELVAWNKAAVALGETQVGRDDLSVDAGNYVFGQIVSTNYFAALGAKMYLGRGFLPEEDSTAGTRPVIVLSHQFWQRQFASDPHIVGKIIRLQSRSFTVVGVTEREFVGTALDTPAFWTPLMMRDQVIPLGLGENRRRWLTERDADSFKLLGRLKPGVAPQAAQAEMSMISQRLAQQYPGENRKTRVAPKSNASFINLDAKQLPLIVPVLIAFGLVLLIACANVANLLLARAAMRQKEIGVRLALGASRLRIIRQLLTESALISVIGGMAGLLAASWLLRILYHILLARLPEFPPYLNLQLDYRIFGFTMLAAISAGVAAGLAPALQASRPDLTSALKDKGSIFGQHLSQSRLRSGLVVIQIAASLTLLIGAGLLARYLQKAQTIDIGFEPQNLISVAVNLNASGTQSVQQQAEVRSLLAERLRALPGVVSVSQAFRRPSSQLSSTRITIAGRAEPDDRLLRANYDFVSSQHFETLGIRIVRGRSFTEQEANANVPVVVISEATAQKFWPGQDAIGQYLGIAAAADSLDGDAARKPPEATVFPSYEVIGIARDTRSGWVWEKDETYLYLPLRPDHHLGSYLLIRSAGNVQRVMDAAPGEAVAIDPHLGVTVRRTSDYIAESITPFRGMALMAGALGTLALLLASIGLYGVMSFVVTQRGREIGVRVALGAQSGEIVRLFLNDGLRLTVIGIAVGLAGAAGVSRLLAAALVDLSPLDPLAFGGASLFLTLVALLATYFPARQAMKIDPMTALRVE